MHICLMLIIFSCLCFSVQRVNITETCRSCVKGDEQLLSVILAREPGYKYNRTGTWILGPAREYDGCKEKGLPTFRQATC